MNLRKALEPSFINLKTLSSITLHATPAPTATNYENISSIETVCDPCKKKFVPKETSNNSSIKRTRLNLPKASEPSKSLKNISSMTLTSVPTHSTP